MQTDESKESNNESLKSLPFGLNEEIDLLEYIAAIFRNKYIIVFFAWICGISAYGLTYLQPILYESFIKVTIIEPEDLGGVSPDNRKAPEILTMVEHGFILGERRDHFLDIVIAKLKSRQFTTFFIKNENIMTDIFYEKWDSQKKEWKNGFKPDLNEAFNIFHNSIRLFLLGVSLPTVILITGFRALLEAYQKFSITGILRIIFGLYSFLSPLFVIPYTDSLPAIISVLIAGRVLSCISHFVGCLIYIPQFNLKPVIHI